MTRLPDPRRFPLDTPGDPLALRAARAAEDPACIPELAAGLDARLAAGDEQGVRAALRRAPSAGAYRALHAALARAVDRPLGDLPSGGVSLRTFALPMVIVAAAARRCVVPATLSSTAGLVALFEARGAIGRTRNFGFSNALCGLDALERASPGALWRASRGADPGDLGAAFPPGEIVVEPGREHAHLRFLPGAGITPSDAPGFAETAGDVAAWGAEASRLLGRELAREGVQLLVLPRAPRDMLSAAHAGRCAQLEVALHLAVSNAVRRFRLAVGDPVAVLSAHDDADLRLTLSSPFAEDMVEGFRWPLHPLDDPAEVQATVESLLAEIRLGDVRVVESVLPAERHGGGTWFPRVDEWDALAAAARH